MVISICYLGRLNVKIGSMQDDELKSLIFWFRSNFCGVTSLLCPGLRTYVKCI